MSLTFLFYLNIQEQINVRTEITKERYGVAGLLLVVVDGRKHQVSESVMASVESCWDCRATSALAQPGVSVQGPVCWVLDVLNLPCPGPARLQFPTIVGVPSHQTCSKSYRC